MLKDTAGTDDTVIPTEKEMGSWFGMLDDASKAEVMKAKIAADAEVRKAEIASEDFQWSRAISRVVPWVAVVIVSLFASCTVQCGVSDWRTVQQQRIIADHPTPQPSAAPAAIK